MNWEQQRNRELFIESGGYGLDLFIRNIIRRNRNRAHEERLDRIRLHAQSVQPHWAPTDTREVCIAALKTGVEPKGFEL